MYKEEIIDSTEYYYSEEHENKLKEADNKIKKLNKKFSFGIKSLLTTLGIMEAGWIIGLVLIYYGVIS